MTVRPVVNLSTGQTVRVTLTDAQVAELESGGLWNGSTVVTVHVPPFPPLDPAGAGPLATLLVVEGVLPLDDAAHAVGTTGDHLVHEATAWGVG